MRNLLRLFRFSNTLKLTVYIISYLLGKYMLKLIFCCKFYYWNVVRQCFLAVRHMGRVIGKYLLISSFFLLNLRMPICKHPIFLLMKACRDLLVTENMQNPNSGFSHHVLTSSDSSIRLYLSRYQSSASMRRRAPHLSFFKKKKLYA